MARRRTHPPLSEVALERVARRFAALADANRVRILQHLMDGERSVQELLAGTGLSQTNLSRHLGVLRREGLVERRADGNRACYRIADPSLVVVCELVCGTLAEQLAGELEGFRESASR